MKIRIMEALHKSKVRDGRLNLVGFLDCEGWVEIDPVQTTVNLGLSVETARGSSGESVLDLWQSW